MTGIGGFAGSHLAEYLIGQKIKVAGTVREADNIANITHIRQRLTLYPLDLLEAGEIRDVVAYVKPNLIFHLAAQSAVPESWGDPEGTLTNNIVGQLNVLRAVLAAKFAPRILIVGSNEEYGHILPDELPVRETNLLRPINPYAVSKVAQDMMGYQYFASHSLKCIRVRPFNHIGPRQSDAFVASAFAKQVAQAEAGLCEPIIRVGNLDAWRDFTDVRDMVRGYDLALTKGKPGEIYNLGSGRMTRIRSLLDFFLSQAKIKIEVQEDPACLRPIDVPRTLCDYSKVRKRTGWEPRISLEQTLSDVLAYWRGCVTKT
ncbi:MAG: GDP-mannose 4,6-dehydratase [Chloroflexota bacterium]